jgi:hypothetical protein
MTKQGEGRNMIEPDMIQPSEATAASSGPDPSGTKGKQLNENPERIEAFTHEVEQMKLRASSAEGERRLVVLGAVALIAGLALAVFGGIMVQNTTENVAANQRAFMATGTFLGIALVIVGAALFVRFSLARYLRFWLVRLVHESRANTDRIVEAIERTKER